MKTFFKRLWAILIILFGGIFLVLGTIVNVFVKLPNNLAVSQGSEAAGILVGTLIGTALFIAICSCIVNAGINQWKDS